MARYDVHTSSDGFLYVEVQANSLSHFNTRVVIPLMELDVAPVPGKRLNPIFEIGGTKLSLVTQYLGTARLSTLGPVVGSLASEQDQISLAIDTILHGF